MNLRFRPTDQPRRGDAILKSVLWLLPAFVLLGGCSTVGDPFRGIGQAFKEPRDRYIMSVAGDECVRYREPFVEVLEEQKRQIEKWAAIGAASFIVINKAVGRAGDDDNPIRKFFKDVVIPGALGSVAGAIIGYYIDLEERSKNTASLRQAVFNNARDDARGSDKLIDGVVRLNRCRMGELQKVASGIRNSTLSKDEARKRLADIQFSSSEDNTLIADVSSGLRERAGIYVNALQRSGAEDADAYIAKAASYKPAVKKPQFTAARASVSTVSLSKRSKRGENGIEGVVKNSAELDALHTAHLEAVDEGIADIETLLL